jgi:hypothetical protein
LAADAVIEALSGGRCLADVAAPGLAELGAGVDRLRRLTRALHSPQFSLREVLARHPHQEASLKGLFEGQFFSDEADATLAEVESATAPAYLDAAS